MQFVNLDGIVPAKAGVADVDDGHEGVAHRSGRSARDADEHLVHEGRVAMTRIVARYHAHARRLARTGLSETETRRDLGNRALDTICNSIREIGRCDRTREGMTRNADRAILTKLQRDAPEAARISRHRVVKDRVIDADHCRSARSAL